MKKTILIIFCIIFGVLTSASITSSENYSIEQIALTSGTITANAQTSIQEPIVNKTENEQVGYLTKNEPAPASLENLFGGRYNSMITIAKKIPIFNLFLIIIVIVIAFVVYKKKNKKEMILGIFKKKEKGG